MNGLTVPLLCALALSTPRSVYRAPLASEGAIEAAELDALRERVDAQIGRTDFETLESEEEAAYSLAVSVDATQADQQLALTIIDTADGTAVVEVARTCELCGRDELLDAVSDLTALGMRKLTSYAEVSTTLAIDSVPPGAIARLDGVEIGTTPLDVEVIAGEHTIELTAADHEPLSQSIQIERGANEHVRVRLIPVQLVGPGPDDTTTSLRRGRVVAGATLVGVGVAALATGITLLVLHGRPITSACTGNDVDLDGDCHYLHDTRIGGAVGAGVGGAAIITGSVILGLEFRRRNRAALSVLPSPTGLTVRF